MKKTIILLFISILILGCSKKNDDEIIQETSDVIISTKQTNLKDTQLSTITVENYILAKETYNAKFGDQDIVLGKVNDSSLTFMVPPNIPSGKYNLVIDIASNTIEFDITKTELTETPENVFSNFVGDYQNEIDQTIALFDQGNIPPQLLLAKDKIDKAITDLNNLSENDKIIAAKFIENNTSGLKELERALSQESIIYSGKTILKKCNTFDCYLTYAAKVASVIIAVKVGTLGATVFGALLGADAIISVIRGKRSVLFSKAKKVFSESLNISIFYSSKVIQLVYEEGNNRFTSYRTANVNPYKIDNNTTIKFNIKPTKRTLNQEDENSSNEIVKNFIAVYLKIKNLWNEHFIDELGTLPTFNDNETQEFADELSQFSLVISNNSENVSVSSISGSVEEFTATFTNDTGTEQDFILDVLFKEGDAEQKTSIDFTIGKGIFGTWNISITDTCTDTNGDTSGPETFNGQIILNQDYTVTYVGIDNSNTVTNNFSFSNNKLIISTSYNDYSITPCDGKDSQLVNDAQTMEYDELNDSFSGTTITSTPEINGVDENGDPCTVYGRTCSGTVTLTR